MPERNETVVVDLDASSRFLAPAPSLIVRTMLARTLAGHAGGCAMKIAFKFVFEISKEVHVQILQKKDSTRAMPS